MCGNTNAARALTTLAWSALPECCPCLQTQLCPALAAALNLLGHVKAEPEGCSKFKPAANDPGGLEQQLAKCLAGAL